MSRGALSALSKKVVDFFQGARIITTVVYDGNKYSGGTIPIANVTSYDLFIIFSRTNVDYYVDYMFREDKITVGKNMQYDHIGVSGSNIYWSQLIASLNNNGMYVSENHNNANWTLGVIKIVGVKFVGGGTN